MNKNKKLFKKYKDIAILILRKKKGDRLKKNNKMILIKKIKKEICSLKNKSS
jgi:hypothetical protein